MKSCNKCHEIKNLSEFGKDLNKKDLKNPTCKECKKKISAKYRADNPEKVKASNKKWAQSNKEIVNAKSRKWREANPEKMKLACANYHAQNKEVVHARHAIYRDVHKENIRARQRKYSEENPERMKEIRAKNRAKHGAKYKAKHLLWLESNKARVAEAASMWKRTHPNDCRIHASNRRYRLIGGTLSKDIVTRLKSLQKGKCACCRKDLDKYHLDHIMPLALGGKNNDLNIQLLCPSCNLSKHAKHPVDFMQSRGFLL